MTPAILIPYLFLTRQGRAGVRATATFCAAALLATAVNASTSWAYWTHYIRDPQRAGMLSWIGNQGILGALERMLGHTVSTPTTFVLVLSVACVGLAVAAAAYRRSSVVLGLLVVEATESLANPVSWSHHFIWVILLVAWLALAEDRPRYGEWYAARRRGALLGRAVVVGRRTGRASPSRGGAGSSRSRTATRCCSSSSWSAQGCGCGARRRGGPPCAAGRSPRRAPAAELSPAHRSALGLRG